MVGIDEVGYGCWAGDLFICALKFLQRPDFFLFDSKKISQSRREAIFLQIMPIAQYSIGIASVLEINSLGLAKAYKLALFRAVNGFDGPFLIDGRKPAYFDCQAVIGGDASVLEISAASIVAKVLRDRYMLEVDSLYSGYGFAKNKGYGTPQHIQALKKFGFCQAHRTSYNLSKYL